MEALGEGGTTALSLVSCLTSNQHLLVGRKL